MSHNHTVWVTKHESQWLVHIKNKGGGKWGTRKGWRGHNKREKKSSLFPTVGLWQSWPNEVSRIVSTHSHLCDASSSCLLHSSGTFSLTWARWLQLQHLACCTWSLCFRYSVRALGSWAYGWYRVARVWEISQAYKVVSRGICMLWYNNTRLAQGLRPKV